MKLLLPAGMEVRHSGLWQLTSVVVAGRAGGCLVVDPGYFPRELDELETLALGCGGARGVLFTHGHWDHVLGWRNFHGAPVWGSEALAHATRVGLPEAAKNLADAREFDGRLYVQRDGPYAWPWDLRSLGEGDPFPVDGFDAIVLHLPGHSNDGLGLYLADLGALLVGDYLSPCEIPFVDDIVAYRATLQRLQAELDGVELVLPGHGRPLRAREAKTIVAEDLAYLNALEELAFTNDREAALALKLPRAADTPGMPEHHIDNLDKVWAAFAPEPWAAPG